MPGEVSVLNEICVVVVLTLCACFYFFLPWLVCLVSGACARIYIFFLHLILADIHKKGIYAGGALLDSAPGSCKGD